MRSLRLTAIVLAAAALTAGGVYAALEVTTPAASSLAEFAPPGALLAIEAPDFGSLLHAWNNSPEQQRWLAGDDYSAFSRSRLFGRLGDAQSEFATAAGLAPDGRFLEQIAGSQSLFAWYDIGNLEFLYITHLSPDQVARMPLLALRDKFEQRQAGGVTFYVRSSGDASPPGVGTGSDNASDEVTSRTVVFAVRGDTLLLASREDLIAGALEQMAHPGGRSLANDPWYAATVAAANEKPGDLRLTLDLTKITRSPYFRSYWVQQNITAMRRYTASLSDLYREGGVFREERFLVPSSTAQTLANADLTPVLRFLPSGAVYRAVANPSADDMLGEIEDKLLARTAANMPNPHLAPSADLSVPIAGDPSDLDDRIDTPKAPTDSRAAALAALESLLNINSPAAMLSFSTASEAGGPTAGRESAELSDQKNIFHAIQSGVVVTTATACDAGAWQRALTAALSPRVSVDSAGLRWSEVQNAKVPSFRLDGQFSLAFAAEGNTCMLASDTATLLAMLSASDTPVAHEVPVITIAGFSHAVQRAPLLRLAALLDHAGSRAPNATGDGNKPPFFSGNMASLSNTFENLDSEAFTEFQPTQAVVRQTITYRWRSH